MRGIIQMSRSVRCLLVLTLIFGLVAVPLAGAIEKEEDIPKEENRSAGAMAFDLVLIRPFGIIATVLGSAFFIVSVPFAATGGNTMAAYDQMVIKPAQFTFKRPLGSF